jgi:hypothetical protein
MADELIAHSREAIRTSLYDARGILEGAPGDPRTQDHDLEVCPPIPGAREESRQSVERTHLLQNRHI